MAVYLYIFEEKISIPTKHLCWLDRNHHRAVANILDCNIAVSKFLTPATQLCSLLD